MKPSDFDKVGKDVRAIVRHAIAEKEEESRELYNALKDLVFQNRIYADEDDVDLPDLSRAIEALKRYEQKHGKRKTEKSKKEKRTKS